MVGVAVNVTEEPAQVGFVPEVCAMETDGVTLVLTVIVMPVLMYVAGFTQVEFDVNIHLTTCPFVSEEVVNKLELVPAFTPLTCH